MTTHWLSHIRFFALLAFLSACGIYRFNDFQTDGAQTIAIHYFDNKAPIVVPSLGQVFTQALKDKYRSESPLTVTSGQGDWDLSGYISRYQTTFLAVQQDQPSRTRLSLSVHVVFVNSLLESKGFERDFEQFVDFDSDKELSQIESGLIEELSEKIVVDIYNATINNW
ncbi:MAG: LptE family protein [Bacteroidetes bacterium]|jgi:hypothetical protein|nr:LptE family protein [Bacteroidota bacterium]